MMPEYEKQKVAIADMTSKALGLPKSLKSDFHGPSGALGGRSCTAVVIIAASTGVSNVSKCH